MYRMDALHSTSPAGHNSVFSLKIIGCFGCVHLPCFLIHVLLHVFTNITDIQYVQ